MLFWSNPPANVWTQQILWVEPWLPTQAVLCVTDYFKCGFSGQTLLPASCQQACDSVFVAPESNATDCSWVVLRFTVRPPKVVQTAPSRAHSSTSSIVNVRMNTAENPIRAVLGSSGVAPCHPFSPFLNVVPFALFLWVQTELFPLGPNVLSLIGDLPWQSVLAHIKRKR